MKKLVFITILIISIFHIHAQNDYDLKKIDSLNLIISKSNEDSLKILCYLRLVSIYMEIDNQKVLDNLNLGMKLAEKYPEKKWEGYLNIKYAVLYRKLCDYSKSQEFLIKALKIFEKIKNPVGISDSYLNLAINYSIIQQNFTAIEYYKKSRQYLSKINDSSRLSLLFFNLSTEFGILTQKTYEKLKTISIDNKFIKDISEFDNIKKSNYYDSILNYNKILENNDSLNKNEEIYYTKKLASYYFNFLKLYADSALIFCRTNQMKANILSNFAGTYIFIDEYEKASEIYKEAVLICDSNDFDGAFIVNINNLGKCYLKLNKYTEAIKCFKIAMERAKKMNNKKFLANSYLCFADYYFAINDYKNAYLNYVLYKNYSDSILNENVTQQVLEINTKYQTEKKQIEIDLIRKKLLYRNIIIICIVIILLLVTLFTILLFYNQRLKNRTLVQQRVFAEKETEMNIIKLKNNELENEKLKNELNLKNKELSNYALLIVEKNEILEKLKNDIGKLKNENNIDKLKELYNIVSSNLKIDSDREFFIEKIELVHKNFFNNLENQFPELTKGDKRLLALIMMDMSSKEIANVLNISHASVNIKRHRLRKKMNLDTDENLYDFLKKNAVLN